MHKGTAEQLSCCCAVIKSCEATGIMHHLSLSLLTAHSQGTLGRPDSQSQDVAAATTSG